MNDLDNLENMSEEEIDEEIKGVEVFNESVSVMKTYQGKDQVFSYDELKRKYANKPKRKSIRSKIPRLDDVIDGFQGGELVIISGRTGEGKTTFAQSLIQDFADKGQRSLLLSYEVGTEDILERFGVPTLNMSMTDETKAYDLLWVEKKIWEAIGKYDIKAVFVDHLHYLVDFSQMKNNSSLVIGKTLRELRIIAIKTKLPIFLICHLTKVATDTDPTINDLRDSSFIGQEADMVLMIWRNWKGDQNESFLHVAKNRRRGTKITFPIALRDGRFTQC